MSSEPELFSHTEWLEQMRYYYSKFEEGGSVYEAAKLLPGVPVDDIWESLYVCGPKTAMTSRKQHPLYNRWQNAQQKCKNPKDPQYKNYGGRGLKFSTNFEDFDYYVDYLESLEDAYKEGFSIDRKDNDIGYIEGNIRWANKSTQSANISKKDNKTGFTGVNIQTDSGRYSATVKFKKKIFHLGTFDTALEAAKVRDKFVSDNNMPHTLNFKEEK